MQEGTNYVDYIITHNLKSTSLVLRIDKTINPGTTESTLDGFDSLPGVYFGYECFYDNENQVRLRMYRIGSDKDISGKLISMS